MRRSEFLAGAGAAAAESRLRRQAVLRLDAAPSGHGVDPYQDPELGVDEIAWLYGDGLVGWSRGITPLLAESLPQVLEAGRRYRYGLREARWHDGKPVVAADVAQAFETIRRSVWGTFSPYRAVRNVVVTSRRSFDVLLETPVPGFARSFFGPYGTVALPILRSEPGTLPIGTGPFVVRERLDLNRWRLGRAETSPRGTPHVDAIQLRYLFARQTDFVPLLSGETDIALPVPGRLRLDSRYRRIRRTTGTTLLLFNMAGPFGALRLRRAFAKAVDVAALQRAYDPRRTTILASFMLTGSNDASLERAFDADPAAAEILCAGLRGHEVRILTVQGSTVDIVAGIIRQTLIRVGIQVRLVPTPYDGLYGAASPLRRGDFDLAMNSYAYADHADLAADWSCASLAPTGGNFARWCDAGFERAIRSADPGLATRRLYDALVAIPLSRAYEDIGISPRVCDVPAAPDLIPATYSCTAWRMC